MFFGNIPRNFELIESDEGGLSKIKFDDIINQNVSVTTKEIAIHYDEIGKLTEKVYVRFYEVDKMKARNYLGTFRRLGTTYFQLKGAIA
ncbi:hypothetical protein [Alkalihalobacillus deserti]|uniref:hypothetical protein n=1 Tax=Alkalihalobacillus deserti TaxID=2879466 RepID=UPI001D15DF0D|nr:hypothetical protein [Alkalihalobacillus deserti]